MQKYVSDKQLAVRYGVSRATVWRWVQQRVLLSPVRLSPGCTRWNLAAIERQDAARQKAGRRQPRNKRQRNGPQPKPGGKSVDSTT